MQLADKHVLYLKMTAFWDMTPCSLEDEELRKMRIIGWRGKARRRDEWKSVLSEVKVFQGP
jgi:hypothetical protein